MEQKIDAIFTRLCACTNILIFMIILKRVSKARLQEIKEKLLDVVKEIDDIVK